MTGAVLYRSTQPLAKKFNNADKILPQVSASSVFAQFGAPAPGNAPSYVSKAAMTALTRTAAKENPKIRVNCVTPGVFV